MGKKQITLLELSNKLVELGYPDIFDFSVEGDILDTDKMKGSLADYSGEHIVEFDVVKIGDSFNDHFGFRDHTDTIVSIDFDTVVDINDLI